MFDAKENNLQCSYYIQNMLVQYSHHIIINKEGKINYKDMMIWGKKKHILIKMNNNFTYTLCKFILY